MKTGIFGGTFDPVHIGHLIMAEQAREAVGLDEVWFVPAKNPPHKKGDRTSVEHRFAMVQRAVQSHPHFRVSRAEMDREGPSYTVDTIESLTRLHPEREFSLIMGADMVLDLPHWHRIGDLLAQVGVIGLLRPGYLLEERQIPLKIRRCLTLVKEKVQVEVSSTLIRDHRRAGGSVRYLVPEPARLYMEENHLYEPR
ncbi:nicotinate-nucleotide adenylyltransferase [Salinithrix halophila]|uniref:Probable nicotinate-nucleotide adenylyltransferase n=1 Tax=Salinithrix halophila TaxID=1485204 RepID=A0ABV8JCZ6_9BACL